MANTQTGYAPINGLEMYYEIHGAGFPLVLLHGAYCTIDIFRDSIMPSLAQHHQVIAIELQGHGHTADADRPFSHEQWADDVAALLATLGIKQADVMGYSLGGSVGLQLGFRHPHLIRKLIIMSIVYSAEGWFEDSQAAILSQTAETAAFVVGSPIHTAYLETAPNPEAWPQLWQKMGDCARAMGNYNWSEQIRQLTHPALIIVGDADGVRLEHAVELFGLFGGNQKDGLFGGLSNSRLAIVPGATHISILERAPLILPMIEEFLAAPPLEHPHAKEV